MKILPIISAFIVGLIFATTVIFFVSSDSFADPVAVKAAHHNSVAGHHAKYI
jgi:hypothetical protein